MDYRIASEGEIKLIGAAIRTSKDRGQEIAQFWQNFMSQGTPARIPNKTDHSIMALYTDYEGDHTQPYSLILGCRVHGFEDLPKDLVARTIPPATYAVFTAKGKQPDAVIATWQAIWESDLARSYGCDFDLYGPDPSDVLIHVAIETPG